MQSPLSKPQSDAAEPIVELVDVAVKFKGMSRPALDHCSVSLYPGELIAVIGHNGAGKSTLFNVVSGLGRGYSGVRRAAILCAIRWLGVGASVGARVDSYAKRDAITTLTSLPLALSAPLLMPVDTNIGLLRVITALNPLSYQVALVRSASWWSVLALAGWAIFGLCLVGILLRTGSQLTSER